MQDAIEVTRISGKREFTLASEDFVCPVDRTRNRLGVTANLDLYGLVQTAASYSDVGRLRR